MRLAVLGHTYIVAANRGKFRHLAARGHQILLLVPRQWRETDFGRRVCEPDEQLETCVLDCWWDGGVRRFVYPPLTVRHALRGWRPDVLLAETEPGGLAALQAAWLALGLGLALVPFAWENLPLVGRSRWLACPVYATARRLLVGSHGAALTARRAGYLGPVSVIPQVGVEPLAVAPPAARRDEPPTVLFIGRLDRKKGADLLLDALAIAPRWQAVIVGDGAEKAALQAQAARLGLAARVRFAGAVAHREVPGWFARAQAFVLPSRTVPGWAEQFGHVLAWAMAAGVPLIASRCGAIPEVVGEAGLLIAENDAPALAAALAQLTDPARAAALAAAGRQRAAAHLTDEAVARQLERALQKALERDDADDTY